MSSLLVRRSHALALALGAGLVAAAALGLHVWSLRVQANVTRHWRGQLSAMAEDRGTTVENWVRERLSDARMVAAYPTAIFLASGQKGPPYPFPREQGAKGHLTALFRLTRTTYGHEPAWLVGSGPDTRVLASTTADPPPRDVVERVLGQGAAWIGFQRIGGRLRVVAAAPVWPAPRGHGRPIGVALLAADPERNLFGLLRREPHPTRTGETLLVRREGSDVLFLSPRRHVPDADATFRLPLATQDLAASAALEGREFFGTFRDYRGVAVLAAGLPLGEPADWGLVVKIDREEALEAAWAEIRRTSALGGALLLAMAGVGFGLWRHKAASTRQALAESKGFLSTLIGSASAAIFTLRPDGRVGEVWNPAAERLFGWTREETIGRPAPFVPADRQDEFRALRQRVLAGQLVTDLEVSHVRRDGSPLELRLAASPLRDPEGRVVAILAVALDATARKRAEKELRESESRFKRLAENAPDVVYRHRLRPSPCTEYVSPAVQAVVGYAPEEYYADPGLIERIIHPDDRHLLEEAARGRIAAGEAVLVRWCRRDGSIAWTEMRSVFLRDAQGEVVAIEGISRDVTQRVEAERTLRQLSAAVEQSPVGVMITDPSGTIDYVNPAFSRQTGYAREEALGQNPRILKSGHHPPEFYAELHATLGRGQEWHGEMLNRRKNGDLYWQYASLSPVVDERGRVRQYLAIQEDVTERKKAEEELRRTQEQLRLSQRLEAVGRLAGGVAHDFNNLLGVIIGHGELAEGTVPEGHAVRERLGQMLDAARRAGELTRQLLAFSRRQVLQPRVVDLNAVVVELDKLLRRLIGEDVRLVTQLDPAADRVRVDPGQMGQVLMNLAVNARDAMPHGGVLTIETSNWEADDAYARAHRPMVPGPYVQIRVQDDGCGMDEAVRERVFEPFFTTKQDTAGSGLGLSTAYGIVKQSGGYIWVDSAPGRGSTITIHLPRVTDAIEEPHRASGEERPGGAETILVAEDQDGLRDVVCEMLRGAGYQVLPAPDGRTALALAEAHAGPIHLLVTDVIMPGLSGRELAERLRHARAETRVLFVSGYTSDVIARSGALQECTDLLEKPFGREALLDRVRDALRTARNA